jgi:hypothetical protein
MDSDRNAKKDTHRARMARLAYITALYSLNAAFSPNTLLSVPLTLPIFALCISGLFRIRSRDVTIGDMFWFCIFIMFAVSPLQRIGIDIIANGELTTASYSVDEYILAFLTIALFLAPFALIRMERTDQADRPSPAPPSTMLLLALGCGFLVLYAASIGGLSGLFASRMARREIEVSLIAPLFLAGLATCCCILAASQCGPHRERPNWLAISAAALLLLIAANPFNISRFLLVAVWAPFVLCVVNGRVRSIYFYLLATLALLVIFPILSLTTRSGIDGLESTQTIDFASTFLNIPFVDIVDTAVHTIRYMDTRDPMLGSKILAIALFFVPRSMWPDKPIVGGLDVGRELHFLHTAGTDNLSFFIASDLYMDFLLIGPALGGVLCALLFKALLDSRSGWVGGQDVLKYAIIGSLPILIRGPVGAVAPFFVCLVVLLFAAGWLMRAQRGGRTLSLHTGRAI